MGGGHLKISIETERHPHVRQSFRAEMTAKSACLASANALLPVWTAVH